MKPYVKMNPKNVQKNQAKQKMRLLEGFGEYTWCFKQAHKGSNAMFSLVNTPMFEQEAPK